MAPTDLMGICTQDRLEYLHIRRTTDTADGVTKSQHTERRAAATQPTPSNVYMGDRMCRFFAASDAPGGGASGGREGHSALAGSASVGARVPPLFEGNP